MKTISTPPLIVGTYGEFRNFANDEEGLLFWRENGTSAYRLESVEEVEEETLLKYYGINKVEIRALKNELYAARREAEEKGEN